MECDLTTELNNFSFTCAGKAPGPHGGGEHPPRANIRHGFSDASETRRRGRLGMLKPRFGKRGRPRPSGATSCSRLFSPTTRLRSACRIRRSSQKPSARPASCTPTERLRRRRSTGRAEPTRPRSMRTWTLAGREWPRPGRRSTSATEDFYRDQSLPDQRGPDGAARQATGQLPGRRVPNRSIGSRDRTGATDHQSPDRHVVHDRAGRPCALVTLNNASAVTLTVPAFATTQFPVGATIDILQLVAGLVTVAGASGVTVHSPTGELALVGQYRAPAWCKSPRTHGS